MERFEKSLKAQIKPARSILGASITTGEGGRNNERGHWSHLGSWVSFISYPVDLQCRLNTLTILFYNSKKANGMPKRTYIGSRNMSGRSPGHLRRCASINIGCETSPPVRTTAAILGVLHFERTKMWESVRLIVPYLEKSTQFQRLEKSTKSNALSSRLRTGKRAQKPIGQTVSENLRSEFHNKNEGTMKDGSGEKLTK